MQYNIINAYNIIIVFNVTKVPNFLKISMHDIRICRYNAADSKYPNRESEKY